MYCDHRDLHVLTHSFPTRRSSDLAMTTFVRVVEAGSFSGAARVLGVGQPAISKSVAHLERHLNVTLLLRSTHGLTPTEAGLRFYERSEEHTSELQSLMRISYAVFCLKKKIKYNNIRTSTNH